MSTSKQQLQKSSSKQELKSKEIIKKKELDEENSSGDETPPNIEDLGNNKPSSYAKLDKLAMEGSPDVNKSLLEELEAKESEIRDLKEVVEELRNTNREVEALFLDDSEELIDLRDKKLIELAKKNKNIIVKLNKEKSKVAVLTQQVQQLQQSSRSITVTNNNNLRHFSSKVRENLNETNSGSVEEEDGEDETMKLLKQFKERAATYEKRMKMLREQGEKHKNENLKLRALIQKEVGDDLSIDSLLTNSDGFRGRAQQIYLLKNKVKDLQKKLESQTISSPTISNIPSPLSSTINSISPQSVSANENSSISTLSTVSVDERQRKAIEKLEQERRNEVVDLKKEITEKVEEIKAVKNKLDASVARNKILEKTYNEIKAKQARMIEKSENDNKLVDLLKAEIENLKKRRPKSGASTPSAPQLEQEIKRLGKDIEQKDEIIKYLKNELQSTSRRALDTLQFQNTSFDLKQPISNTTPDEELRLKLTITTIELEKLKELKKVTGSKITELEQKLNETNEILMKERLQTSELERKCQFLKGERNTFDYPSTSQLQEEIMLLRDENEALKLTIEHSKRSKEEEIRTYQEIIETQKRNYEQHITALKDKLGESSQLSSSFELPSIRQRTPPRLDPEAQQLELEEEQKRLLEENDQLKRQLGEIKNMYNTLAYSQQQRKKFTLNK